MRLLGRVALLLLLVATTACRGGKESGKGEGEHAEGKHAEGEKEGEHEEGGSVELSEDAAKRVRITTAAVESRALALEVSTTGQVDYDRSRVAQVGSRLPGRVNKVEVTLGASVKKGQVLAWVDSIDLGTAKSEHLKAKTRLKLAKENYDREKQLAAEKVSSEREMLTARAGHEEALSDYNVSHEALRLLGLSESQIEESRFGDPKASLLGIRAPFDGKVVELDLTQGEVVTAERNLFTVADLSRVCIWIDLYERDVPRVHLDDEAIVRLDAFPERDFRGKISYIRDEVDPQSRTVRARVDVANTDGVLKPKSFAKVLLSDPHGSQGAEASKTLVIPDASVQREGNEQLVFIEESPRHYQRREVQLGRSGGGYVEVLSGVAAGEKVVVEGAFILKSEASKAAMGGGHSH